MEENGIFKIAMEVIIKLTRTEVSYLPSTFNCGQLVKLFSLFSHPL